MSVPLNQSYRIAKTLAFRTDVKYAFTLYEQWLQEVVRWVPHDLHPSLGEPGVEHVGRSYDAAIALVAVDFTDKDILELGARASFLSPFVTDVASRVYVTDLFRSKNLGNFGYWSRMWKATALKPDRLYSDVADMRRTLYPDGFFDVVLNISAIEHVPGDDDTQTMIEMARICRPGGFIVVGTDISDELRIMGGRYYDEAALYERLIKPSGCELHGEADLSWEGADKSTHKSGEFERSCCIFILRKP